MRLWKAHLKYWSGTAITTTPTRLSTRSWCCQNGRKTWILYHELHLGTSWRTQNSKSPRQLQWAPRDFSLPLTGRRTNLARPTRTKSRRSNWHVFNAPLLNDVWYSHPWLWCCFAPRGATIMPAFTGVFGSATTQHNPTPTGSQISDDLARTCWLHNTLRGIDRTWRNAISDSNRLRQHCQVGPWEEISLCKVRAPNKILHTEQDTTTHFFFLDDDTIETNNNFFTMSCSSTDHKIHQLEHLKQPKLIRRTGQL